MYELHHELPNDVALGSLEIKKIRGNLKIECRVQPNAQSPFHKYKLAIAPEN